MPIRKICIFRTGALGDVILTLPVIQNLRHAFPNAQIHLIGNPHYLSLAQAKDVHVHDINRAFWAPLFAPQGNFSQELLNLFQNTDLAWSYLPDPNHILTHNLHRLGISQIRTHPPKPKDTIHATEHLLMPLRQQNIPTPELHPKIQLTQADHTYIHPPSPPILLMHPGSGGKIKCWPPEHFASIADVLIHDFNGQVVISSGPADEGIVAQVVQHMTEKATILPQLSIRHFAAFMTTCTAYLGNDSGPSHLSAAIGLPTITLFGPTDPQIWSPRGLSVHIIQSPTQHMVGLTPKQVYPYIQKYFSN